AQRPEPRPDILAPLGVTHHAVDPRAVGAYKAPRLGLVEEWPAPQGLRHARLDRVPEKITTQQRRLRRPAPVQLEEMRQLAQGILGEPAVGGDLAAVNGEHGRGAVALV